MAHSRARSAAGPGFLDPQVLSRIDSLDLLARTVVDGFIQGLHRSPLLGLSLDFAEHRPYMPGDDIRRVDWRRYARTDRYYVKEFEAETNTNITVLLDVSPSMAYASGGVTKLDYGRYLAACLAYFSHGQRDRVGLATFAREVLEYVPPSASRLDEVLHTIDRVRPGEPEGGDLGPPLQRLASHLRRRGIVALISDLYEQPEAVLAALKPLRARGSDLIVFHVLDPAELEFPFDEAASFQDLESGESIPVAPGALRPRYRELMQEHVASLTRLLAGSRIDHVLLNTARPLDFALFHYLSSRQRLSRTR